MRLTFEHYFDAGHQLPDSDLLVTKKCANRHGHTYKVKVEIYSNLNNAGMITDFSNIKNVIDQLDHQWLNDYINNPTAENIALWLRAELVNKLKLKDISVGLCEGWKGKEIYVYA